MGEPIKIFKGKKVETVYSAGALATAIEAGWKQGTPPEPIFKPVIVYKGEEEAQAKTADELKQLVADGWGAKKPE